MLEFPILLYDNLFYNIPTYYDAVPLSQRLLGTRNRAAQPFVQHLLLSI